MVSKVPTYRRKESKRELRRLMRGESAEASVGELYKGCEIYGLTKGQFSLSDIIRAVLKQTGPATLQISTWTAAKADIREAHNLLTNGNVKSIRFLVDRSFPGRQPEYCKKLIETFGSDAIRVTRSHAKFVLIQNEEWNIVIRTSMNLNENPRVENFEISDDKNFLEFMQELVDEIWEQPEEWLEENFNQLGMSGDVPTTVQEVSEFDIEKEMEEAMSLFNI